MRKLERTRQTTRGKQEDLEKKAKYREMKRKNT